MAAYLGWLFGVVWLQQWRTLPERSLFYTTLTVLLCLLVAIYSRLPVRAARIPLRAMAVFAIGLGAALVLTYYQADERLALKNTVPLQSIPETLTFQVVSLVHISEQGQTWVGQVVSSSLPEQRLSMRWFSTETLPEIMPGQIWRAQVRLQPVHRRMNGVGFDGEQHLFTQNIHQVATIQGTPELLADTPWAGFSTGLQRVRTILRANMQAALGERRYAPVLLALAMGDQSAVPAEDWEIFRNTGITHLVSISGLHVTCIASIGGLLMLQLWKRWHWRGMPLSARTPAQMMGALVAICLAGVYCLLAGWGIPAQRTFFMLACIGGAMLLRLPMTTPKILLFAAWWITFLDPWAVLSAGFWLSFGAVSLLILAGQQYHLLEMVHPITQPVQRYRPQGLWQRTLLALQLQWQLSLCLIPLTVASFSQFSVVSPIVNALAIPIVSFIVTPLVLFGMFLLSIPGIAILGEWMVCLGHMVFEGLMTLWVLPWSTPSWASWQTPQIPWYWIVLACMGCLMSILPYPIRYKHWGLIAILPLLCYAPSRVQPGEWRLHALDVGQGTALLVETQHHVLLVDTGPPLGAQTHISQTVLPYLAAHGRTLHTALISHADLDHAAGLAEIVEQRLASQVIVAPHMQERIQSLVPVSSDLPYAICSVGMSWEWDGVYFDVIHPSTPTPWRGGASATQDAPETNANSCVVVVTGKWHNALLPGDVGVQEEQQWTLPLTDVVVAAHHGSKSSSSAHLIAQTRAQHTIFQMGFLNRYRHPHPEVWRAWQMAGSQLHRTDWHGAIVMSSLKKGLHVERIRERDQRYWHTHYESAYATTKKTESAY